MFEISRYHINPRGFLQVSDDTRCWTLQHWQDKDDKDEEDEEEKKKAEEAAKAQEEEQEKDKEAEESSIITLLAELGLRMFFGGVWPPDLFVTVWKQFNTFLFVNVRWLATSICMCYGQKNGGIPW